jgi:hypothetical protein
MNTVIKTDGKFILVADAALSAREKSADDQNILSASLEESALRQILLRILIRLEALEKR